MRRLLAGVVSAVVLGLVGAPAVEAHELTCSKSRFGHRAHLEKYVKQLKVDDVRGAVCFDTGKSRVRYVACRGRVCVRQDVHMYYERAWGPLWIEAMYKISRVRWGYYG